MTLVLWVGLGFPNLVQAAIYQCVTESGVLEFRDKPCSSSFEQKAVLSIAFQKTPEKEIKKQEKEIKVANVEFEKQEKKHLKIKERITKKQEQEKAKLERKKIRCSKLDEKIKLIENQLKQGCKMKKQIRLNEQLQHC